MSLSYPHKNELSETEIARRLAEALKVPIDPNIPDFSEILTDPPHNAAVLIPLLKKETAWHVLLTRRNTNLHEHSGQVAFPGGRADPGDCTPEQTALRETLEEIGIAPQDIRILGRLQELRTITNYNVTPVVGVIPWPYPLRLATDEVSRVFTIPLAWLANPVNREMQHRRLTGHFGPLPVIYFRPYDGEILWGASARFIMVLLKILNYNGTHL